MILDRMLLSLQTRVLLATLAVLLVLGLVVDFFESARYLFSVKGTAGDVLWFYLYKIPFLAHLLLPISLVLSAHISFALLGRGLQLRAIAAAGIGPLRLAAPTMALAGIAAVATVLLAEFLVPPALEKTEELMVERFGLIDQNWRFYRKHYWFQGEPNRLFRVDRVTEQGRRLRGATLFEMDSGFHVSRKTNVRRAVFRDGRWTGSGVQHRTFDGGRLVSLEIHRELPLDWPEGPGRFRNLRGRPKQKSLGQLAADIEALERRGLSADRYRIEYHNRFAYPLLALGLVLLVLPWLCAPSRKRTLAGALIEATGYIFGAYFLVMLVTALVTGGALSAAAGVWFPVLLVLAIALAGWAIRLRPRRSAGP